MSRAPLLIVGGYGLVGGHAARVLRRRHPDLPLVLAGRNPARAQALARELGADTVALDVRADRPLDALTERPAAVLAAVSDPHDRLLADALRRGIPLADINRGGQAVALDAAVRVAGERPTAPLLLAGGWLSGLTALAATAVAREVGCADRIDIAVMLSSGDRVGPDAWGFSRRLAWPFHAMESGRRTMMHPLTGMQRVRCADGRVRPGARVGTLEQITLPITLGVPTVTTRLVTADPLALWALVGLKRLGLLRALAWPPLGRVHDALLQRSGPGDVAAFTATARVDDRMAGVEALDVRGQGHLNGVGAAIAAERVLGLDGAPLPPGISFPEQSAEPSADIATLRGAGVVVRCHPFHAAACAQPVPRPTNRTLEDLPA